MINLDGIYNIIKEKTKDIHFHDYKLGVLLTYRNLPKLLKKFSENEYGFNLNDEFFYTKEINKEVIEENYSFNFLNKINGSNKRCEICYKLDNVFNKLSYENRRKYDKRIQQSLNYFKNNLKIAELNQEDERLKALKLYQEWCDIKLNDGKTFKIMFPNARYRNCINYAFDKIIDNLKIIGVLDNENNLLGFRVVYLENNWAYDLAYCTERNKKICTDFSERFNVNILKYLKDNYQVEYFNCGLASGSLKSFKKHLPNFEIYYYRKSKKKIDNSINDLF